MNKTELTDAIVRKTGLKKKESAAALDAVLSTIQEELQNGGSVSILGFGTFEVRERAARSARNPRTGETINVEESRHPAFRPGSALRDAVNEKK